MVTKAGCAAVSSLLCGFALAGCIGGSSSSGNGAGSADGTREDSTNVGGPTGASARACLNDALYQSGTTSTAIYETELHFERDESLPDGPFNIDAQIVGLVEFQVTVLGTSVFEPTGQVATEVAYSMASSATMVYELDGETFEQEMEPDAGDSRFYFDVDTTAGHVRTLGEINIGINDTGGLVSTSAEIYDPYELHRYDLSPGDSYEQEYVHRYVDQGLDEGYHDSLFTQTVTYDGRETVTVPAGTFEACRFTISRSYELSSGTRETTVEQIWEAVGDGVLLRSLAIEGGLQSFGEWRLLAATVNGVDL